MALAFTIAVALLSAFLVLRSVEIYRGSRFASTSRTQIDAVVVSLSTGLSHAGARCVRFARSDVLMKGIHVLTYAALVFVRFLEKKLVKLVHVVRHFRQEQERREPSHKLAQVRHTRETVAK